MLNAEYCFCIVLRLRIKLYAVLLISCQLRMHLEYKNSVILKREIRQFQDLFLERSRLFFYYYICVYFIHLRVSNGILQRYFETNKVIILLSPFQKTLPRSSAFVNWISARFYETGGIIPLKDKRWEKSCRKFP